MSILEIINYMLEGKGLEKKTSLTLDTQLRNDLGFDSFDLAELTVRIEDIYGVDIFANGIITTVGEIENIINTLKNE